MCVSFSTQSEEKWFYFCDEFLSFHSSSFLVMFPKKISLQKSHFQSITQWRNCTIVKYYYETDTVVSKLKTLSPIHALVILERILDEELRSVSDLKSEIWDSNPSLLDATMLWDPEFNSEELKSDSEIISNKWKEKYTIKIDKKHDFLLDQENRI